MISTDKHIKKRNNSESTSKNPPIWFKQILIAFDKCFRPISALQGNLLPYSYRELIVLCLINRDWYIFWSSRSKLLWLSKSTTWAVLLGRRTSNIEFSWEFSRRTMEIKQAKNRIRRLGFLVILKKFWFFSHSTYSFLWSFWDLPRHTACEF